MKIKFWYFGFETGKHLVTDKLSNLPPQIENRNTQKKWLRFTAHTAVKIKVRDFGFETGKHLVYL